MTDCLRLNESTSAAVEERTKIGEIVVHLVLTNIERKSLQLGAELIDSYKTSSETIHKRRKEGEAD